MAINERGATICRRGFDLIKGREVVGSRNTVKVPLVCPPGSEPFALWHTHPGGDPNPSPQDIREVKRLGLAAICVTVPQTGETRCKLIR